jgi:hypothetical protein
MGGVAEGDVTPGAAAGQGDAAAGAFGEIARPQGENKLTASEDPAATAITGAADVCKNIDRTNAQIAALIASPIMTRSLRPGERRLLQHIKNNARQQASGGSS